MLLLKVLPEDLWNLGVSALASTDMDESGTKIAKTKSSILSSHLLNHCDWSLL